MAQPANRLLEVLPSEILLNLLEDYTDVRTVWNVALTCKTFYSIVTEHRLAWKVLHRHIDDEVLDLAFTATDAKSPDGWLLSWLPKKRLLNLDDIKHGLATKPASGQWSVKQLIAMDEMHNTIEELLDRIVAGPFRDSHLRHLHPISRKEACRIQNALYRVEIFCALHDAQPIRYWWQRHLVRNFFIRYNAWENEQVACVWDNLKSFVRKAIISICECEAGWRNYMRVKQENEIYDKQLEFCAMKGLSSILSVIRAETREELIAVFGPDPRKSHADPKLSSILSDVSPRVRADDIADSGVVTYGYSPAYNELLQLPLMEDNDTGPEHRWIWAHPNLDDNGFVFGPRQQMLRRNGYVLWDRTRDIGVDDDSPYTAPQNQNWDVVLARWQSIQRVSDAISLERAHQRSGSSARMKYEDVEALIDRNVLEHEGYGLAIELSSVN